MKNVYKRVYFRINTPSYYNSSYGVGFGNENDRDLFHQTITELFLSDGWSIKEKRFSGGCSTVQKDKQELYLHPQSISGVVSEVNILDIEDLLMSSNLFEFTKTDTYEDVYDITNDEYIEILESKKEDITNNILTAFKTKRRNLFITCSYSVLDKVLDKYRIKRLSHFIGVRTSSDIDVIWISNLFENLINEGKIITSPTRNGTGYRSIAQ